MNRLHLPIAIILFLSLIIFIACGNTIKTAQEFKPNNAPSVSKFSVEYIGSDSSYNSTRLYSGMPFLVTVDAADPEGKTLTYSITSSQGTFSSLTTTDNGVSCKFYIGTIMSGDKVSINLSVIDPKKASFSQMIDVGTGKTGPGITVIPPTSSVITPSGDTTMTISCDSSGIYRVYRDNTITSSSNTVLGSTGLNDYGTANTEVTMSILGPSSTKSNGVMLENNVKNYIWVVFRDNNDQTAAANCTMYVEGTNPYVRSNAPGDGDKNITVLPTISVLFSKAINESTLTHSTIAVTDSSGTDVDGTLSYNSSTFTETFIPTNPLLYGAVYTVKILSAVTDTAGNEMVSDSYFSFTTASKDTLSNIEFFPIAGTYTGTQNVTLKNADTEATILYTTDGTIPTCTKNPDGSYTVGNGNIYSGTITANRNTTIRSLAYKTGTTASGISSAAYSIKVNPPQFAESSINSTTGARTLSITSSTPGATIYYTTDGNDPSGTSGESLGSGETILIRKNMTVRTIAKYSGMTNSDETSETYHVKVSTPVFSLAAGTYDTDQTLYLTSDSGAVIYYSTDGTTPTTSSSVYSWGVPLSGIAGGTTPYTITAIAVKPGLDDSVASETKNYSINYGKVSNPVITIAGSTSGTMYFNSAQTAVITCATAGATMYWEEYYLYDSSGNPITISTADNAGSASSPITLNIDRPMIIKVYATKNPKTQSDTTTSQITLQVPTPSIAVTPSTSHMFLDSVLCSLSSATIRYTTTGTPPTSSSASYSAPVSLSPGTPFMATAYYPGWMPSATVSADNSYYLYVPYGTSTSAITSIRQIKVDPSTGTVTDLGAFSPDWSGGSAAIDDCLLDPSKQCLVASTYSVDASVCHLMTYRIPYATGALSTHVAQQSTRMSSSSHPYSKNLSMAFNTEEGYLLIRFFSNSMYWFYRTVTVGSDGSVVLDSLGLPKIEGATVNQIPLTLFARPSYGFCAPFYAVDSSNNTYYVRVELPSSATSSMNCDASSADSTIGGFKSSCFDLYSIYSCFYLSGSSGVYYNGIPSGNSLAVIGPMSVANAGSMAVAPVTSNIRALYIGTTVKSGSTAIYIHSTYNNSGAVYSGYSYAQFLTDTGLSGYYFTNLAADPSGKFLFAVAQKSNEFYICSFSIDPSDLNNSNTTTFGKLTLKSKIGPISSGSTTVALKTILAVP